MKWIDILRMAMTNLMRRKLRSALTMLGVVIGTAAIVVTISLGYGAEQTQMEQLSQATNLRLLQVSPKYAGWSDTEYGSRTISEIRDVHINEIRNMEGVAAVTPVVSMYQEMSMSTGKYTNNSIWQLKAVNPSDFAKIKDIDAGSFFTGNLSVMEFITSDLMLALYEAPDAQRAADYRSPYDLFYMEEELVLPNINWFGANFDITFKWYDEDAFENEDDPDPNTRDFRARLTGFFKADMNDWTFNESTIIDINWLRKTFNENKDLFKALGLDKIFENYTEVLVLADSVDSVSDLTKRLNEYGVYCYSPLEYLDIIMEQIRSMQGFLGFIGAISMLVAALSIANTMMMSIYERTREIGVMKVLGCRLGNIRMLFLAEAAYIGMIGGALGLVASYAASYALNNVSWMQQFISQIMSSSYFSTGGTTSVIPTSLSMGTWLFVIAVSLCSGLYPAYRAMRLSSLAAIRNAD